MRKSYRVKKPWGFFEVLAKRPDFWVKRIAISKGHRTSLQSHCHRSEIWIITNQDLRVEVNGRIVTGPVIIIPPKAVHRISSPKKDSQVIEVAWGKCLEEDVIRYEDDYGRIIKAKITPDKLHQESFLAIILAGGQGTRLQPITYEIPKPLLPVKKKPIVSHLVDLFTKQGINNIILVISREWEREFLSWRDEYCPQVEILIEEKPLGTFGAINSYFRGKILRPFFLSNGDELKEVDLKEMMKFHQKHKALATIALKEVENPQEYGVAVLQGLKITRFIEKPKHPPSRLISGGLYILEPKIFDYIDQRASRLMIEKDVWPILAKKRELFGYKIKGRWFDCGTLERWEKAVKEW